MSAGNVDPRLWDALGAVIDPELGVPVTELGLVYSAEVVDRVAHIVLTMTSPVCPLGEYLSRSVENRVEAVTGVDRAEVDLVTHPLWNPGMMTDVARRMLGWDA